MDGGRDAYREQVWGEAYAGLWAADRDASLEPADLECLAIAAYLTGRDTDSVTVWTRAYHERLARSDIPRAVRCAFWLGFALIHTGERARAGGWFARARRLLDDNPQGCVEQGYLLMPDGIELIDRDPAGAYARFDEAEQIAQRFADPDLLALARHGRGRALIRLGEFAAGVAMLDEVMVAITAGEVSAMIAGDVYCSVIEACHEISDLRRAHEWTAALSQWCDAQPDLVPYRGQCLIRRAEIMQLRGEWQDAMEEARRARERLSQPPGQRAIGAAFYQQAELHRLRGEFAEAEDAYRQASQWGRSAEPGLSRLRLARGQIDVAAAAMRREVDEARSHSTNPVLLAAHVEIMLAAADPTAARGAADQLASAALSDSTFLRAMAAGAQGRVLLAEDDAAAALDALRRAWTLWHELEAPYEAARIRVLIGLACRALGDEGTAQMEFDAARWVFEQLGAAPDLDHVQSLPHRSAGRTAGLTTREVQVLRLVAAGKTNRAIANDLFISEKTVARHVSNIFTKLDLSSRSAATAYAYEHGLIPPSA
ncbi:MAG: LuxR C-terminal-related transcriptional regulator [Longimicrobiales bacterium]